MSSIEATDWLASMQIDPDESERADARHALMMSLLVRLLAHVKRGVRLPTAVDFLAELPWRDEYVPPPPPPTPAQLRHKIDAVMMSLGGKRHA